MKALRALIASESKLFLREGAILFFAVPFPAVLVLVLGSALPGFTDPNPDLGGARGIDIYLPIVFALAIATVTMTSLLTLLTGYREKGILLRLRTTPISPAMLLIAQFLISTVALVLGCLLAWGAAKLAFDVQPPHGFAWLLVAFLLGAAAMGSIALLVAALVPSTRASVAWGSLIYYPMMFAAGVWTPGPLMPESVRRVADFTPLGAASEAMQAAWAGGTPRMLHLAVMAGYVAVLGFAAVRLFRWR
jgi:ABC-2 type transport system permease protein